MSHTPDSSPAILSNIAHVLTAFSSSHSIHGTISIGFTNSLGKTTMFSSSTIPKISLHDYLCRIYKLAELSEEVLVAALIYLDRFAKSCGSLVSPLEIHRLLAVSCMTAAKFLKDDFYDNAYYAKVAGITLREINELEAEFLTVLKFSAYIMESQYEEAMSIVQSLHVATSAAAKPTAGTKEIASDKEGLFECIKRLEQDRRRWVNTLLDYRK